MDWQTTEDKRGYRIVTGMDTIAAPTEVAAPLLQHFISDIAPLQRDQSWDYIRVELWPDSGRIIALPASSTSDIRIENGTCQVISKTLLTFYNQLADSSIPDDEFTDKLLELATAIAESIISAAHAIGLANILNKDIIRIACFDSDETTALLDVTV